MKIAGITDINDFDVIEANEAFAAQSVAVQKDLGFKDEVYMYCKRILDLDSTNSDAKEYLLLLHNSNH